MSFPRYPKYKDSGVEWLGKVPAHWEVVQFKLLADIQNGADHKHVEQEQGYPVLGSGGIFTYASDYLYDGESVLLGRKGTIDKPLYVHGRFWTVDTMYWTKIRPNISARFVYYTALTIPFDYYSTSTALPSMTQSCLNSHWVVRPPRDEEVRIAKFLDRETAKIDELVAEQRRLMELLKEKRRAVISHAVTKGLNPHAPLKASGINWLGAVPRHWSISPIGYRYSVQLGKMLDGAKIIGRHLRPYLRVLDVQWGAIYTDDLPRMDFDEDDRLRFRLQPGDLLVNEGGSYPGRSAIWNGAIDECYYQKALHRLRANAIDNDTTRYFFYVMSWAANQGVFIAGGNETTIEHLPAEKLRRYRFAFPPYGEQTAIADFLDSATAKFATLVAEAQRAINLLQERRTALISAAVTGQIDVRDWKVGTGVPPVRPDARTNARTGGTPIPTPA